MSLFNHYFFFILTFTENAFGFTWIIALFRFPTISHVNATPFTISIGNCRPSLPDKIFHWNNWCTGWFDILGVSNHLIFQSFDFPYTPIFHIVSNGFQSWFKWIFLVLFLNPFLFIFSLQSFRFQMRNSSVSKDIRIAIHPINCLTKILNFR